MPKVSIVSIAKNESEFIRLKKKLKKQTFKDWEFVYSTKKGIPQAWNDAIKKAKGNIIIITESDALPLTNNWIKDMVKAVKKNDTKTIIRGIEVIPTAWDFSNLACYSKILKQNKLDENYSIAEDTELFARLRKLGYKGKELSIAPIVHMRNKSVSELIKNNFLYGILLVKIQMKYGQTGFKTTFRESFLQNSLNLLKREIGTILSKIMFLIGAIIGLIIYFPSNSKK
jgi:glycosyltransferase involved in cell wall biosynthesis